MEKKIRIKKVRAQAKIPTYGTEESAGADLYACIEEILTITPQETVVIPTGLSIELPKGYMGLIMARSGLAIKHSLAPANKVGLIDSDYRGEYMVALHNHGKESQTIEPQERIAQLVIVPYLQAQFEESDHLSETGRSSGKFGSTGKK